MYGYRHLRVKPWIQFQVILEMCKPPAAEPKIWPTFLQKQAEADEPFGGDLALFCANGLPFLCMPSWIYGFVWNTCPFFQVCFKVKALKLPQGLQICMNQPEVTPRPRDKLKVSTFTQLLIRTLSQNKERQSVKTRCVHCRSLSH